MLFRCVICTRYASNLGKKNYTKRQSMWKFLLGSQKANDVIEHHTLKEPLLT